MISGLKGAFLCTGYILIPVYIHDPTILLFIIYALVYVIFYVLHTRYTIRTDVPSCGRCVSCRAGQQIAGVDP